MFCSCTCGFYHFFLLAREEHQSSPHLVDRRLQVGHGLEGREEEEEGEGDGDDVLHDPALLLPDLGLREIAPVEGAMVVALHVVVLVLVVLHVAGVVVAPHSWNRLFLLFSFYGETKRV